MDCMEGHMRLPFCWQEAVIVRVSHLHYENEHTNQCVFFFAFFFLNNALLCYHLMTLQGVEKNVVTYKTDLLRHLDLGHNSTSYIICKASCVTDTEGIGTWIKESCLFRTGVTRQTKMQLPLNPNKSYRGL